MHRRPLLRGLCCFQLIVAGTLAAPLDAIKDDEETLKAAKIGTDDATLIDFFRSKTTADGDREKITALIGDLAFVPT
jgi:hypothetical protein